MAFLIKMFRIDSGGSGTVEMVEPIQRTDSERIPDELLVEGGNSLFLPPSTHARTRSVHDRVQLVGSAPDIGPNAARHLVYPQPLRKLPVSSSDLPLVGSVDPLIVAVHSAAVLRAPFGNQIDHRPP